ncbi:NAD-dependent epimerase/dehydratase family protein [Aquisphaera insulae]|uniref:NAD-dependent epimerase/dehydratase family protein n=1 Tax=Aquisphaera insulae TaxID=2712864 RepID=UPI0013EBFA7B|nr:NAD-dependent epimerase/dehydratase family protein [Aquisphaera insulae]
MSDLAIVTGGAGFIGSHLVRRLAEAGREVRVIERPGADLGELPAGVEVRYSDIRDRRTLAPALRGAAEVYHLAANPNLWARDRGEFDAVNHVGAVNVLELALESGARRVVHTSTESILTRGDSAGPIDENVQIHERDAVGPYCLSKLRAEDAAMGMARRGLPVVVVNPTMPIGPGDRGLSPPSRLILDFCRGKLPVIMDCTLNLIDVRDVAAGLELAMARGEPGRRHLLAGENLTLAGLLEILSGICGVPAPRWRVPYAAALAIAHLSEFRADHLGGGPPRASVTGVRLARRIMHFDPSQSLAVLGLRPRPIRESLADAVNWLVGMGHLARRLKEGRSG